MVSFPLPILTFLLAAVAGAVVFRQDIGPRPARWLFLAFFATVAFGSLMVGLRFGYGVEAFVPVQRALPLLGGPLLYLGFAVLSVPEERVARLIVAHLGVVIFLALAIPLVARIWIGVDLLIPLSYLVYAVLILRLRRRGANHLTRARLGAVSGVLRMMGLSALFLLAFALGDSAISISFALDRRGEALAMISGASVVLLGIMAAIILRGGRIAEPVRVAPQPDEGAEHAALAARADAFLVKSQLYLDTDLTVDRLAKRLHVPARNLSAAINSCEGVNVSQYVNGFRLRHAAGLLESTDMSVVKVMEESGFLTRSNFYREFQRAYGKSPAAYRGD